MYIYFFVKGFIFRLYVLFLLFKICDYCLLMFLIVYVYDVLFNVNIICYLFRYEFV